MPEILPDHVPSPRTPLVWDGTRYRAVRGHTDGTIQVRGEDQLFSYKENLVEFKQGAISGANGFFDSNSPPAGQVWVCTTVAMQNISTATTEHYAYLNRAGTLVMFHDEFRAYPVGAGSTWSGHLFLHNGDVVRAFFAGALAGDTIRLHLGGYIMTLEA